MAEKPDQVLRFASPLVVIAVGFALFAGSLRSPFTSDDVLVVFEAPQIYNIANLPRAIFFDLDRPIPEEFRQLQNQPSRIGLYRPVLQMTFVLNALIFGDQPFGWRLTSLLLHLVASLLLLGLARSLLGSRTGALAAAVFFVAHPVHTEAVAMLVGGRSDLLACVFVLAAWWVFLSGDQRTGWRRWASDSGSALLFLLGLWSKENAVVLPGILLLSGWALRGQTIKSLLIRLIPFAVVFISYVSIRLFVIGRVAPISWSFAFGDLSAVQIFLSVMTILIRYIGLVFWPYPLQHQACYHNIDPSVLVPVGGFCALIVLVLVGISVRKIVSGRRNGQPSFWAFGLILFFLCLVPVSHLVPFWVLMAERFVYIPSLAFCLVAGYLAVRAYSVRRWLPAAAVAVVLAAYTPVTISRNSDWADLDRLWGQVAECNPDSPAPYSLMGTARMRAGKPAEAIKFFEKAVAVAPRNPSPLYNLGLAYHRFGNTKKAEEIYRRVIGLEPRHSQALNNLGILLESRGELKGALQCFKRAVEADPSHPAHLVNLGNLLQRGGQTKEAEKLFRAAARMAPRMAEPRFNLARLLEQTGRGREAERFYRGIIKSHPRHAMAHNNLANLLKDRGQLADSERLYRRALDIDPECIPAHLNLAWMLLKLGRTSEARTLAENAAKIEPEDERVAELLGILDRASEQ